MKRQTLFHFAVAVVLSFAAIEAAAAGVTVGAGSTLSLGNGRLSLGCSDLVVAGTLGAGMGTLEWARDVSVQGGGTFNGESATLSVTGDWSNAGVFAAGTSVVYFVDGCEQASSTISGDSTFYDLDISTTSGKLCAFAAGSTTTVTNFLTLAGVFGDLLQIRSTVDGSEAYLDLQGSHSVAYVEVKDNHATGNPVELGPDSSSLGNTPGWEFSGFPVPSVSAPALVLLALWVLLAGRRALDGSRVRLS